MNLHAAAAYARHLLTARSTAGHGVHSPFMFSFITEVIGGKSDPSIMKEVESLRREMLADRRVITVRDLGAGSAVIRGGAAGRRQAGSMEGGKESTTQVTTGWGGDRGIIQPPTVNGVQRSIRQIAAAAAVPKREAAMLVRIAGSIGKIRTKGPGVSHGQVAGGQLSGVNDGFGRQSRDLTYSHQGSVAKIAGGQPHGEEADGCREPGVKPERGHASVARQGVEDRPVILELGTSLGISTLALALGAPGRRIISIEGCPGLAAIARENLKKHGAQNAEVLCMEFSEALALLKDKGTKVVLAFIDGNHRGAALAENVHIIREMGEEIIIVADDIHMNKDMIQSWQSLSSGNLAPASLETFRTGMLFCLRNLTPGRYRVR